MLWFFYMVLLFSVVYVGYIFYISKKQKKKLSGPRCEKCGSPMELQTRSGDEEIWECPVCREKGGSTQE